MKKIVLISLLLTILSYGKNIDDLIKEYENSSYTTKLNNLNINGYEIKEKVLNRGDWNEIIVNSTGNYEKNKSSEVNGVENSIKYGNFYYKNSYDFVNDELIENKIGISKTLNDIVYSDNKYNKEINNVEKKIQNITNNTNKNSDIRNLIDLYKDYKNKEKEIEQNKISLEGKEKDLKILAKKYEIGTASEYDYKLAKYEYETSQLTYENLQKQLQILEEKFLIYNIQINKNEKLEDLEKEILEKENFYSIRTNEAENIKLNETINEIKIKKEKFDNKYPKITTDAGYSIKNKSVVVGVGISKTFKTYDDTIQNLQNEKEKLQVQYEQKKLELLSNVGQEMINYTTYQTEEIIAKKAVDITKLEYEIYTKKYELGVESFSEYVEKRNNYDKAVINYEKAKNELAAFTKKIKYY